ncbi:MAG: DNA polymerase/3'-5' exonuclease PolX [Patescibacteria group bacterium]
MSRQHPTSQELSRILFEFAYWHEMQQTPFKPRAYQLASESVSALGNEVEEAWKKGGLEALEKLPAIGKHIAEKTDEYFRTGRIKEYDVIKKKFPVDIWGLAQIEGVGPRHIFDLYKHLKVRSMNDLKKALDSHKVRTIPRWGEKSEDKLMRGLALMERASGRRLLGEILPVADTIVAALSKVPGVKRCAYAGSLRRRQETVGDIDLIATTSKPEAVMNAFVGLPLVETVHERGKTRASVRLAIGIDADLRVVPDNVFGATLQYFTGDKRHNVLLREFALSHGFTLNEYGLFRLKRGSHDHKKGSLVVCKTEEAIYKKLGMDTPPPEIRVGDEEIDAARRHSLPSLIPYGSVKGDLQVQTSWTDGSASIEEMAKAAKDAGLSYMAVTDHTKSLAFVGGLTDKRVAEQAKEIARLNKKLSGFRILRGTECDILKDGSLDLSDKTLASLEWVGVSVHSNFNLSRAAQTARVVKALSNPNVDCYFHPTCRLIGKRDGIDLDMDEIIAAAKKCHVALEIDGEPNRSDLRDLHVRMAVRAGVMLTIDSDAHAPDHFRFLPLGEAIARRGWAPKKLILNCKTAKELLAYLDKKPKTRVS